MAPVAYYRYDEFGKLMKRTGTLDQPFMFSTKRYDEKTGLSYYGYTAKGKSLMGVDGTNEFEAGGDYEGWRMAIEPEIIGLWPNAQIPCINNRAYVPENFAPIRDVQALLGIMRNPINDMSPEPSKVGQLSECMILCIKTG